MIKAIEATGNEELVAEIQKVLGAGSQTAEEAFLTSVRVRRANIKARAYLVEKLKKFKAEKQAQQSSDG